MYRIPTIVKGTPMRPNSKKPNVPILEPSRTDRTMALGGVPAKVIIPPRPAAKASGIRSLPRAMPEAAAMPIVTGSSTAVVLVLDNAAESTAASTITAAISPRSLPPASLVKKLPALVGDAHGEQCVAHDKHANKKDSRGVDEATERVCHRNNAG